jgi:hypothetical protein
MADIYTLIENLHGQKKYFLIQQATHFNINLASQQEDRHTRTSK